MVLHLQIKIILKTVTITCPNELIKYYTIKTSLQHTIQRNGVFKKLEILEKLLKFKLRVPGKT